MASQATVLELVCLLCAVQVCRMGATVLERLASLPVPAFLTGVCPGHSRAARRGSAASPVCAHARSCGDGRQCCPYPVTGAGHRAVLRELSCSGAG